VGRWKLDLSPQEAYQALQMCAPLWREVDPEGKWLRYVGADPDLEGEGFLSGKITYRLPSLYGDEWRTPQTWQPVVAGWEAVTLRGTSRFLNEKNGLPLVVEPPSGAWQYGAMLTLRLPAEADSRAADLPRRERPRAIGVVGKDVSEFAYRVVLRRKRATSKCMCRSWTQRGHGQSSCSLPTVTTRHSSSLSPIL
jgi:hypothetical protein